jgi:hypothetical protein
MRSPAVPTSLPAPTAAAPRRRPGRASVSAALFHAAFFAPIDRATPPVVRRFRELARVAYEREIAAHFGPDHLSRVRRFARVYRGWAALRGLGFALRLGRGPAREGTGRLAQWRSTRQLLGAGVRPGDYYRYSMHRVSPRLRWFAVSDLEQIAVQRLLHPDAVRQPIDHKARLAEIALSAGLPMPRPIAEVTTTTRPEELARLLPEQDLFVKFANLGWGIGALAFRWNEGNWIDGEARRLDRAGLAAELCTRATTGELVVQEALTNGGSLRGLTPGGLATFRIVTLRPLRDATPMLLGAVLRIPALPGAITDNFANGGLAAPVEDSAGTLGRACTKRCFNERLQSHPCTRRRIHGTRIEEFPDAVRLAISVHRLFPRAISVGWDIAITADGPTLIEGNVAWCPELMQQVTGVPLLATAYGETYGRL